MTYSGQAATHVSVGHREAGLIDGFLKDQVDDTFQPFFCVDGQFCHLCHQLIELLRCQFVQDAADFSEKVLRVTMTNVNQPLTKQLLWFINEHNNNNIIIINKNYEK